MPNPAVPKDTFNNLPAAKRLRIEAALAHEFAIHGYRKASLNTVVKSLGIAKGSLYQYFDGKESIFLYVFDRFTDRVKAMLKRPAAGEEEGLWETLRQTMRAGIAFIDTCPDLYQLYLNALFEHEVPRREELIRRVRLFSLDYFGPLVAKGQARGEVSPLVPVARAVFMIDAVLDRFLQGYARPYLNGGLSLAAGDAPAREAEIEGLIAVLRRGLAAEQGSKFCDGPSPGGKNKGEADARVD